MELSNASLPAGETSGRITSWRDFEDRIRAGMAAAATHAADLTMVDASFQHWPLGQRAVVEAFHQWGLHDRAGRCTLLAADYGAFPRTHPLWLQWRAPWAHRVHCLRAPEELCASLQPMWLLHGTLGLRLHDSDHGIGVWTRSPGLLAEWLTEADVILQRSEPAMPPTTLGL